MDLIIYFNKLFNCDYKFNLDNQANIFLTDIDNNIININKEDLYNILTFRLLKTNIFFPTDYALTI